MLLNDLSAMEKERIVCSIMAAVKYEVPTNILLAIAEKEGGKPNLWSKNKNGSYDIGTMQFNTSYLQELGISPEEVAASGCYPYDLAAWRIRSHLKHDNQDVWTRAANYHSKTPKYNRIYREDLIKKASKWEHWLNACFLTYSVTKPGLAAVLVKSVVIEDAFDSPIVVSSFSKPNPKTSFNNPAAYALASVFRPDKRGEYS